MKLEMDLFPEKWMRIHFSKDGKYYFTYDFFEGDLTIWDWKSKVLLKKIIISKGLTIQDISPDNKVIALRSKMCEILLYNIETETLIRKFDPVDYWEESELSSTDYPLAKISNDGKYLLTASCNYWRWHVHLWLMEDLLQTTSVKNSLQH